MSPELKSGLLELLGQEEGRLVEKKESLKDRQVAKAVVAFANSVMEGETAVLFLGASEKGNHPGLANIDDSQRKLRLIIEDCYPAISYTPHVLPINVGDSTVNILAVLVPYSPCKPHFAGLSYVRIGSESKQLSKEMFYELVSSQNDKTRRLLRFKGQMIRMRWKNSLGLYYDEEGVLESCDALTLYFRDGACTGHSLSIDSVSILATSPRLMILCASQETDNEHIRKMLRRFYQFLPYIKQWYYPINKADPTVVQFLNNFQVVSDVVFSEADGTKNPALKSLRALLEFENKKTQQPHTSFQKHQAVERMFLSSMSRNHHQSNGAVLSAVTASIISVATSFEDIESYFIDLRNKHPGYAWPDDDTFHNAIAYSLSL